MSVIERAIQTSTNLEVRALPRKLHVPDWDGNIRNVLVKRLAEVGYNLTRTPSGKYDENGNEIVDVTFENREASYAYNSVLNGQGIRILKSVVNKNPYSPHRPDWVRNGIPAQPSVLRPGVTLPPVLGVNDLVPPPHQLEIPQFAAFAPQAA